MSLIKEDKVKVILLVTGSDLLLLVYFSYFDVLCLNINVYLLTFGTSCIFMCLLETHPILLK